ncbi:MAG: rhomboid family intramembrane serine protease [Clostridium sp.]|nr:rhomboid family intramembrane serine protease [Clostridium sp.]
MDNFNQLQTKENEAVAEAPKKRKLTRISYNAPVVLTFAIAALIILILDKVFNGKLVMEAFSVYRSPISFGFFIRLFGHTLGHASWAHLSGNMMLFLLLGPILEEKYGSGKLLGMIAITAVVSGLVNILFFPHVALLGASGIVFMMIILTSASSIKGDGIPLTMILIIIIYLGAEVVSGIFENDNISQLTHIIGGICGAVFGIVLNKNKE